MRTVGEIVPKQLSKTGGIKRTKGEILPKQLSEQDVLGEQKQGKTTPKSQFKVIDTWYRQQTV